MKHMKKYLLPENMNFYKANLHCHTTFSDAKKTPEQVKDIYKELGYSVLAVTDKNGKRACTNGYFVSELF